MKNSAIIEASRYTTQILPLKSDVYRNGSSTYSNFKNLVLTKEIALPKTSFLKIGVLPEMQAVWYTTQSNFTYNLHLYRYDLNSFEVLPNFSSEVLFVKIFKPLKGIFNQKISHCLIVLTESDAIIYGVECDSHSIINTEFSCKLHSKPSCISIHEGNVFIGCYDGNVYHALYKSIDMFNYKYLNVYSPGKSIVKSFCSVFKKKNTHITCLSSGSKYLVAITKKIEVYNVETGIYKLYDIPLELGSNYTAVHIFQEIPLMFYCVSSSGIRDFYTTDKNFSLDPPVVENSDTDKMVVSVDSRLISVRSTKERSSFVFNNFNEDQLRNFSKLKPIENYEIHTIYNRILDANISQNSLHILTPTSLYEYSILDSKKLLLNCRTQEIYLIFKNYGDIEFMVKYFNLLTDNEEVTKLEGLCKNDSIKLHALFIWIYTLIEPIWKVEIKKLNFPNIDESANYPKYDIDEIIQKLKILKQRLTYGYDSAKEFIEEFIQTRFYTSLLIDYNVPFDETFESILTRESDFKSETLKKLLETFTLTQSIELLLKTMQNHCPLYLPLEQINLQRGLQLMKKDDRESLMKSLEYLSQAKYDKVIIDRFNEFKFYYGSALLIKEKFDFSYETAINLFSESIKCKKAFDLCLDDTRESFLYPFFECILGLESFSDCICCDVKTSTVDLISIENPLFKIFLKDFKHKNEKAVNLHWKYLLYRNQKMEAIESLINLTHRSDLSLEKKVGFLQTALSISTGTYLHSEIKLKLKLYEIQKELMIRVPSFKTNTLLDSDTLFNDYCYDHIDLKIRVLDLINYKDEKYINELLSEYFKKLGLRDCLLFIKELSNVDLESVFDHISSKIVGSGIDFCNGLKLANFEYEEIVNFVKEKLSSNLHPDIKMELLKSLKMFSVYGEYKECESICDKQFGIRIYK